jgi:peptidoglycan/LPS O-acetylase OafA/YrhL
MILYRSDIDGLRAVSILAVVAYHADLPFAPGGFVGVDVFFVISGYLITALLTKELVSTGRIDLPKFWGRRIRRLLPSVLIVILVSAFLATQILPPHDLRTAGADLVAASAYFVNWQLALRAVNYLAEGERHSLLLHFWSLSVEEQFYLFWPISMMALGFAAGRKEWPAARICVILPIAVVLAALCSFLVNLYLTAHSQPWAFFGTISRAWQLLAGALIAVAPRLAGGLPAQRALALSGTLLIAAAILLFSRDTPYPGIAGLVPVCGAMLVVLAGHCETGDTHPGACWLTSPVLVFVGRASYAWYLWHWPILLLGDAYLEGAVAWQRGLLVGASFVLAAFTYIAIEQPIRSAPILVLSGARSIMLGICITAAGALVGLGLQSIGGDGAIAVARGVLIEPQKVRDDIPRIYRDGCHLDQLAQARAPCIYGTLDAKRTVVLFGDSHAAQWFPALETAARNVGWRLLSRTRSACPSIEIRTWSKQLNREVSECSEWRNTVLAEISQIKPQLIILANQSRYRPIVGDAGPAREGEKRLRALRGGEMRMVEAIRLASNAPLVLLRDTPQLPDDPLDCLARRRVERCTWPRHIVLGAGTFPLADYTGLDQISLLDLSDLLCGPQSCPALKNDLIVMRDKHHLTASFANTLAAQFERLLAGYAPRH